MRTILSVFLTCAVTGFAGCGTGTIQTVTTSAASAREVVLPEMIGATQCHKGKPQPDRYAMACGMGFLVRDLTWHNWGEPVTYADGTARTNDCLPDCARGAHTDHRIQLIASQIQTCANGQRRYTRLTWSFPDGSPSGETSSGSGLDLSCPPT
jgi:hypothetical protein